MRAAARVIGIAWVIACAVLWLWIGLIWDWSPVEDMPFPSTWSVFTLLQDSKFGLTMVPILLGGVGAAILGWGSRFPSIVAPTVGDEEGL